MGPGTCLIGHAGHFDSPSSYRHAAALERTPTINGAPDKDSKQGGGREKFGDVGVAKFATEHGHKGFVVESSAKRDAIGVGVVPVCKGSSNSRKVSDIIRLKSKLDQGQLVLDGLVSHKVDNVLCQLFVVRSVGGAARRLPKRTCWRRHGGFRQLAVREHRSESSRMIVARDRLSQRRTALACIVNSVPRFPH